MRAFYRGRSAPHAAKVKLEKHFDGDIFAFFTLPTGERRAWDRLARAPTPASPDGDQQSGNIMGLQRKNKRALGVRAANFI
jgi:hypothetical protein